MELIVSLIVVSLFIMLNNVRVGLLGNDNPLSELLFVFSSLIGSFFLYGFLSIA